MKSRFFLDVVITQSAPVFQLLSGKNQALLIWRNSFLILDLGLYIIDGIRWFHIKGDSLTGQSLHKDLHSSSKTENQVKSGFLLNIVITQSAAVFKLFTSKNKALLIRWNTFLILNLCLHIIDGIGWFDIQSDSLTGQSLHKDLHSSSETED